MVSHGRRAANILLVKLAAIGDIAIACQSLQRVAALLAAHQCRIHWVIDPRYTGLARTLLAGSNLDVQFISFPSTALFTGALAQKLRAALLLTKAAFKLKPDVIAVLHRDRRYRLMLRLGNWAPTFLVSQQALPEVALYEQTLLQCLHSLSGSATAPQECAVTPPAFSEKRPLMRLGILVGGARNDKVFFEEKRWPHFAELASLVLKKTDATIDLFGGPEDCALAAELMASLGEENQSPSRINDLTGQLNLEQLPAALSKLDAFVSIDSGLAHIAAASMKRAQQRIVTLFGPTDPRRWGPQPSGQARAITLSLHRSCSPCYLNDGVFKKCSYEGSRFRHCLNELKVEDVFAALIESNPRCD